MTKLKKEVIGLERAPRRQVPFWYDLLDIENCEEIAVWIQEAESKLNVCPCCGKSRIRIRYGFALGQSQGVPTVSLHKVYAWCLDCGNQSKTWHAEDSEGYFKEALEWVVNGWNRRFNK